MLTIENLNCGYSKNNPVLKGINLSIEQGETLAVFGQNGAGKSTLTKAIVNTLPYKSGSVWFNSKDISKLSTKQIINCGISVFSQGGRTFPQLTVSENILFAGRDLDKKTYKQRYTLMKDYFEILKDTSRLNLISSYLSGGEKNQLAMAMALINSPKLLILDEMSAGVSPAIVQTLFQMLAWIKENENITILLIEQNQKEALKCCNKFITINNGIID